MPHETDSLPRIALKDLFLTLGEFEKGPVTTLERLRCRICVHRKHSLRGDVHWSTARDNAVELRRLGLVEANAFPKDKKAYEMMKDKNLKASVKGAELLAIFRSDRALAYDELFKQMYAAHPYLRAFVRAVSQQYMIAPVITSLKGHVSPRYGTARRLFDDVSQRRFDTDALLSLTEKRIQRRLASDEVTTISSAIHVLLEELACSATNDAPVEFAKKLLLKLNDIVISSVFRATGLGFDFRTHRTLWTFGQEWKLWQATSSHPDYDGHLIHRTATIRLGEGEDAVRALVYDSGLAKTAENFYFKLFEAYQKLKGKYVPAWALRAVFCFDNACQDSVFDKLMEEHYTGSDEYDLQLEIHRQKGAYDRPLRIGNRNIGLIRVVRKAP